MCRIQDIRAVAVAAAKAASYVESVYEKGMLVQPDHCPGLLNTLLRPTQVDASVHVPVPAALYNSKVMEESPV